MYPSRRGKTSTTAPEACRLCNLDYMRIICKSIYDRHGSGKDRRSAGKAQVRAADQGGAALAVLLGAQAGLPQCVDADDPGGEGHRPVAEIVDGVEPHTEIVASESAETREQREEHSKGEREGDGEPRHEKTDDAAREPPDEIHRSVDRIEPEAWAETRRIGAEAVIGVGPEHDEPLDEKKER